ncbi:MAG: leucine-rich repeat domain-containing protein, partial [Candidatus Gracilibacteria bacterium]
MPDLKRIFSKIVILSLVLTLIPIKSVFALDITSSITDPALLACLRGTPNLGIPEPTPITDTDAAGLTHLSCSGQGITSLAGLEYFTSLGGPDLSNNSITDLSPISAIPGMSALYLSNNQIPGSALSSLSGYTSLGLLELSHNLIDDVSGLATMGGIQTLNLDYNLLTNEDVADLAGLTALTSLNLEHNQISDISGLSALANLGSLNLSQNQIVDISALSTLFSLSLIELDDNQIFNILPLDYSWFGFGDTLELHDNPLNLTSIVDIDHLTSSMHMAVINYDTGIYCGNGTWDGESGTGWAEECDDTNNDNGDGCSSSCQIEDGYTCEGAPSVCGAATLAAPTTCQEVLVGTDSLGIGWADNSADETGFEIQKSTNASDYTVVDASIVPNTVSYTVPSLSSGVKYWLRIRALGSSVNSSWLVCDPMDTNGAPVAPSGLEAAGLYGNFIEVQWVNNAETEDNFVLEMSTNGVSYTEVSDTIPDEARGYGVSGLTEDTQYWFRVKASNTYGDSSYATLGPVTTLGAEEVPSYLFETKWTKEWQKYQNGVTYGVVLDDLGNIYTSENGEVIKRDVNGNYVSYFDADGSDSIKIYDGDLYVTGGSSVEGAEIYDVNGSLQSTITASGNYEGIVRDSLGNVYLADNENGEIDKYNSSNEFVASLGAVELTDGNVYDVDIDSTGSILYVADVSNNNGLLKFNLGGTFTGYFVTSGNGADNQGIFVDASGNVYTAGLDGYIRKYSSLGVLLVTFTADTELGDTVAAYDVYADGTYIYIAGENTLLKYDMTGAFVDEYVGTAPAGQLDNAQDLDVNP